jgi:hypothetical protein
MFEWDHLRASFLNNLPFVRDTVWSLRARAAKRQYDVRTTDELPSRFIYYPLQMTPESSINNPAPYFVDQMRAIDAIRLSMPNDCLLVVKEHPAAIITRPTGFVRALSRRAGVVVAHVRMSSSELIRRAACTISVTGTATMEAFLMGRPAIMLGPSLIADYLGGPCPIDGLRQRILDVMANPPADDYVRRAVAEILSVRRDFTFVAPRYPGEPALRRNNIEAMARAMIEHMQRIAHDSRLDPGRVA